MIRPTRREFLNSLGAFASDAMTCSGVTYHGEKMVHYGAERLNSMFAVRSFLDAGIKVTQPPIILLVRSNP